MARLRIVAKSVLPALGLALGLAGQPARAALFERRAADLQAEVRSAGADGRQLAVFLTLPDCPGCLEMERKVFNEAALERAFARKFRSVRLDIAQHAGITDPAGQPTSPADFAHRLRAVATPTLAFFDAGGQVLYRYTGTLDGAGLRQLADYVSRGDYEKRPFAPPRRNNRTAGKTMARTLYAEPPGATLPQQPEFTLAATDGRQRQLADFRGLAIALAVGYTQCPDVCPTTLSALKAAVEALPAGLRPQVQLLFATLDPERDSLAILEEYAAAFRPQGGRPVLGLRGTLGQTAELIRQLQLVAERQPSASMGYTLDHSAGVFLFDGHGRLLGISPYGQPPDKLGRDLAALVGRAAPIFAKR